MSLGIVDKSLEGRRKIYFPHEHLAPLDPEANFNYRKRIFATKDLKEREYLKKLCKEDFMFYLKSFVYIFQAKTDPKPVPFLPYPFQSDVFLVLWKCMHDGQEDCRIKKPRDVGATWAVITLFEHTWRFRKYAQLLVGSRREEELDGTTADASGASLVGQWSKLLPKVDFIHEHMPNWMWPRGYKPRREPHRTRLKITNPENGSLIQGESASPRFGRSSRYYAIGFDEHAHTEHGFEIVGSCSQTSDCHIWWSSPNGPATAFAMLGRSPIRQVSLSWDMHPLHAEGMTIDPDTGRKSSPWFEKECARVGYNQKLIGDEILADETQAGGAYYGPPVFEVMEGTGNKHGTLMDPVRRGEFDIHMMEDGPWVMRWCDQPNGRWSFWKPFDAKNAMSRDTRYVVSVDVAAGSKDAGGRGASNSVIAVGDGKTGELVGEFAHHGIPPYELAEMTCAVGRWLQGEDYGPAYVIYEKNGPGGEFGDVLTRKYRYTNVYREKRRTQNNETTIGWFKNGRGTEAREAFGLHTLMLVEGRFIERSRECAEEMRYYNHNPNGSGAPVHAASINSKDDPSGARDNHGDRVITRIMMCHVLDQWLTDPPQAYDEPPRGSIAWIQQQKDLRGMTGQLICR